MELDGFGVVVEEPGHEGAEHEARALKGLMDRGRLMHTACDRLEVLDVEGVGPQMTVPADDVERMMVEEIASDSVPRFDAYFELTLFIVGDEIIRWS